MFDKIYKKLSLKDHKINQTLVKKLIVYSEEADKFLKLEEVSPLMHRA